MLFLPSVLMALSASYAYGASLQARQADNNLAKLQTPISFAPDQNWDGIDGSWSSFTLQVGTPPQFVRTFVSFSAYQTWVVLPEGCQGVAKGPNCKDGRGGIYSQKQSSTFNQIGLFDLDPVKYLGYGGNAIFGLDSVGLGGEGEGGPTLNGTVVGGFAALYYYLGVFGINPKPSNFTGYQNGSTSYLTLLKQKRLIPSVSAGYTAGAPYAFGGAGQLASLTLGGNDASRYVPNNLEFTFGQDNSRDILVAIQSVSTPSNRTTAQLLPNPVYAYIDSTVPSLWLPQEACTAFEDEFGLVWDNKTALYLLNSTQHDNLKKRNPTVTFTLAQAVNGGPTINITLPYAAFDLQAKPPYQGLTNNTYYFPLMRAANESRYVLGRAFLQEAYLSVNWETQKFNVSQVNWQQHAEKQIIALPSTDSTDMSSSNNIVTSGAIGGIIIGALFLIALVTAGLSYNVHRRKKLAKMRKLRDIRKLEHDSISTPMSNLSRRESPNAPDLSVFPKAELEGSAQFGRAYYTNKNQPLRAQPSTVSSQNPEEGTITTIGSPTSPFGEGTWTTVTSEADGREVEIHEMLGDMPHITEKDSRPLTEKEALHRREQVYNGVTPPMTATSETFPQDIRRPSVRPEEVALVSPTRGSFSTGHGTHVVSPTTPAAPPYSATDAFPPLPEPAVVRPLRRAFSFEDMQDEREMQRATNRNNSA